MPSTTGEKLPSNSAQNTAHLTSPITLCKIANARKPTSEVTDATTRSRTLEIQGARTLASAGDEHSQIQNELRIIPWAELQTKLKNMYLAIIRIPDGLFTVQTDIGINWSQTRQLRRWHKGYGITVKSERTSRNVALSLLSKVKVKCDILPFTIRQHDGASSVEAIPCASIPLDAAVSDHLTRSANRQ
ncbi:Hypp9655 [Branchiostoma lanceolatum]|uniref:Hypp9655 protein n=1 Tax=Branchiostoma lanceolatum TaxID=7740 RepID=A0A8S4MPC9_BRALA|nr:Hypp9655 [Branchiostoma lanceolatum]